MTARNSTTAILLINLGTPDSPSVPDVRSYLRQFLNDPRVIDIPWLLRKVLVNLVIVPFRAPRSAATYRELWTPEGSPLRVFSERAGVRLQEALGPQYTVYLAMRYKNPSIPEVLERIRRAMHDSIVVFPMFPHFASASTGSAFDEVFRCVRRWWTLPAITFVGQYYDHPQFISAFAQRGKAYKPDTFDHVLFSYHGLPERHVLKAHEGKSCEELNCRDEVNRENNLCYRATCYQTSRRLASALGIPAERYSVSFQSRLNDRWLKPFTDHTLRELAQSGVRRVLVFSPAFTADCLETIVEIGREYRDLFLASGGVELRMVESLNDHPAWIDCMKQIIMLQG